MARADENDPVVQIARTRYLAGEKPASIGEALGLSAKTVSNWVSDFKWRDQRGKVGEILAEKTPEAVAARLIASVADYVSQHTDDWQALRVAIMAVLEADFSKLDEEQIEALKSKASFAIAASKAYKEIQAGQRLSLGLLSSDPPPSEPVKNERPDFHNMDPAERRRRIDEKVRASRSGGA